MSVNNGENASAEIFNPAFVSKTVNSTIISRVTLNKAIGSGAQVTNTQLAINDNIAGVAANVVTLVDHETRIGTLETSVPQSNYVALTVPGVSNDDTQGYSEGSEWLNTNTNAIYKAVDVSTGAAIWKRLDTVMLKVVGSIILDFSVSNVGDAAYVELSADIGASSVKRIQSFYPDGDAAYIAVGAAAFEVDNFILIAGGNGEVGIDVDIPANSRLSIKLLSGGITNTSGKMILNLLGEA